MFLLNSAALEAARQHATDLTSPFSPALQILRAEAEKIKATSFLTVMDKEQVASSGNKHDYYSFGPYWWPNPETSDGLPYVRRDGLLNPETAKSDNPALAKAIQQAEELTLAYFYTRNESLAEAAAQRLRAWFVNEATRMNPHLEYAQAIPGVCNGRGIGIIDTVKLRLLPDVLELLQGSPAWGEEDSRAVRRWMADFLEWLLTSQHGLDEARERNNHGSWYDVQVALLALATERQDVARRVLEQVPEKRFMTQLAGDGSQPHELARTRAFSYSCYNLLAFFDLATLAESLGIDLWHWQGEDGASLKKALEFLTPYADPDATWPYPQVVGDDRSALLVLLRRAQPIYAEGNWNAATAQAEKISRQSARLLLMWPVFE